MNRIKLLLFFVSFAALLSCGKETMSTSEVSEGNTFVAGQKVSISLDYGQQTKLTGHLNTTANKIDFVWEEGDKILVSVRDVSAEFTLVGGAGTSLATFSGEMPAGGSTFDIQYPVNTPDLSSQTYSSTEAIPHDMMLATATECTTGTISSLQPIYGAIKLNLYGIDREVSQIVVTNVTSTATPKPSYTLTCITPVKVGNTVETAVPFFIVVPTGSHWDFDVRINTSETFPSSTYVTPTYSDGGYSGDAILTSNNYFATKYPSVFTPGIVHNMPAVSLTAFWAPVNCGYDATNFKYGRLYQFGRKVGCGYDGDTEPDAGGRIQTPINATFTSCINSKLTDSDFNNYFFYNSVNPYDWFSNDLLYQLKLWPIKSTDAGYVEGKIGNPCPDGWRVPTDVEEIALIGNHTSGGLQNGSGVHSGMTGMYYDGSTSSKPTTGVFLPAAGYCDHHYGGAVNRRLQGEYWASSVFDFCAWYLYFNDVNVAVDNYYRADAFSVRCIFDGSVVSGSINSMSGQDISW